MTISIGYSVQGLPEMSVVRHFATAGAMLALAAIGLRPSWPRRVLTGESILVTPGADAAAVRRLVDSLRGATVFTSQEDLAASGRRLRRLHVVGWGLPADQWPELGFRPVILHPAPTAPGFTRVTWSPELVLGDALVIEGRVAGLPAGTAVWSTDPAGRLDSTLAMADGSFRLDLRPRGSGRQLYLLQAGAGDHTAAGETLAVSVITPPPRRILILEAAPSFETSALRDWLAVRNGAVAIRTAVSRDRYRTEFVNRDRIALTPVTDRLLTQFDLVEIDGRTLIGLSATERATLRQAVTERGLGVLMVADTVIFDPGARFSDRGFFFDFALRRVRDVDQRTVRPAWAGLRIAVPSPVPAEPYALADRFGIETIIDDGTGQAEAQVAPRGAGRIGVSLVTGSTRWLRGGQRDVYAAYWSRLLAALTAGTSIDRFEVETAGPWLVNRPLVVRAAGSADHTVAMVMPPSGTPDTVFLARDPLTPDTWRGVYWPRETGWHQVGGAQGTAWFVQGPAAWRSREAAERLDASALHAVLQPASAPSLAGTSTRVPIPRRWFFGLFVLCAAVLWSSRRPAAIGSITGAAS